MITLLGTNFSAFCLHLDCLDEVMQSTIASILTTHQNLEFLSLNTIKVITDLETFSRLLQHQQISLKIANLSSREVEKLLKIRSPFLCINAFFKGKNYADAIGAIRWLSMLCKFSQECARRRSCLTARFVFESRAELSSFLNYLEIGPLCIRLVNPSDIALETVLARLHARKFSSVQLTADQLVMIRFVLVYSHDNEALVGVRISYRS